MSEVVARAQNMTEAILTKWVEAAVMPAKITSIHEAETNVFYLHFSRAIDSEQVGMIRACGFCVEKSPRFAVGSYRLEWIPPTDDED